MHRPRLAAGVLAIALAALGGCAAPRISPPPAEQLAPRSAAARFELEGRLSATDGERAANGQLHWAHAPGSDAWTLYSPLGQIVARLEGSPAGAVLRTADGHRAQAAHIGELLPQLLGVDAPLDGLDAWVQAVVRPQARVLQIDEHGRPARVSDAGWIIDYAEYDAPAPDAAPRRIDAHWGDTRIRLIIDEWTLQP